LPLGAIQKDTDATPLAIVGVIKYPLLEPTAHELVFDLTLRNLSSVAMEPLEYNQEPEFGDVFIADSVKITV
jgi:hypothetical protein